MKGKKRNGLKFYVEIEGLHKFLSSPFLYAYSFWKLANLSYKTRYSFRKKLYHLHNKTCTLITADQVPPYLLFLLPLWNYRKTFPMLSLLQFLPYQTEDVKLIQDQHEKRWLKRGGVDVCKIMTGLQKMKIELFTFFQHKNRKG